MTTVGKLKAIARFRPVQTMLKDPDVADAYEELLGDLRLSLPQATGNSILVASTAPNEGKTTVSSCLAITASRSGLSVLLIDGDLRRSSLTAGEPETVEGVGFIEILLGQGKVADAIHSVEPPEPLSAGAISFMPAGRRPPTSLGSVDWAKARSAIKSLSEAYGLVLIDSPPILAVSDALLVANIVDAVLLVIGTGAAQFDEIRRAKGQLLATGTPIIGAVLNRFKAKAHGPSSRPYSGYYRRSLK